MRYEMRVFIHRPIEEVWAFLADLFNTPRLRGMTLAARQTSPGPIGLGATVEVHALVLGFETGWSGAITEWDPPDAMTVSVTKSRARSGFVRQTLEASPDGTKVTRTIELELGLPMKLVWIFGGPFLKRRWDASTRNLKRLVENWPQPRQEA